METVRGKGQNCKFYFVFQYFLNINLCLIFSAKFSIVELINSVRNHPILYLKSGKTCKDSRDRAWNSVCIETNLPCKLSTYTAHKNYIFIFYLYLHTPISYPHSCIIN